MKDLFKNPAFYYICIPLLVGIWPLLLFATYLPNAKENKKQQIENYEKARDVMLQIISLAPERFEIADVNEIPKNFTYDTAVLEVARECKIQSNQYELQAKAANQTGGQNVQSATIKLYQIDIETFAKFLNTIELNWPKLVCTDVKLNYKQGEKDIWDVTLNFKYYE